MTNVSTKNHLSKAKSPYLLQHAANPVHWFEWSDEAFQEAKKQDKPIFLSIGYATCHWCHVMAHESFEDEAVANLMNEGFVSIKVDREERPDIDNTYMTICQMLTGRGGWPLTIVMTPEKRPFYAATYIPKHSRHGQPGMMDLIPRLSKLWNENREKINGSAKEITQAFQKSLQPQQHQPLPENILDKTVEKLRQQFNETYGGFGSAPKFPVPHTLIFLLRYAHAFDDKKAAAMAEQTLVNMRRGGIFDHLGGGFHRYSTDNRWLLPHFEKMLYDQAMHLMAYTEGWQALENPLFKQTAQDIVRYLFRDLQDEGGAFYSAEDADSEGEEGTFYVWSIHEIRELLSPDDAELTIDVFNIESDGNYNEQATGQPTGKNILHRTKSIAELAEDHDLKESTLRQKLDEIKEQLFEVREKRERPFLDDKILTDWNGLVIAALAKAGRVLEEPQFVHQAERAAHFIFKNLQQEDGQLLHRWRNGKAAIPGTVDDYAFFIWGLIELYESTFKTTYLKKAVELQELFIESYWDNESGGFYFTAAKSEQLLGRKKEYFDSALPSGNSVAAMNLLRLGRITAKPEWEEKADQIIQSTAKRVEQAPTSFTQLLQAQFWASQPSQEIVIAGERRKQDTRNFINQIHEMYLPNAVVMLNDENDSDIQDLQDLVPYLKHQPMKDGKATAYVCQNYACEEPVHEVEAMVALLI